MRATVLTIVFLAVGFFGLTAMNKTDEGPKITICHIPPGNPDNAHSITISINALPAHLAHGDSEGACEPQCTLESDPDCFCELFPDVAECN